MRENRKNSWLRQIKRKKGEEGKNKMINNKKNSSNTIPYSMKPKNRKIIMKYNNLKSMLNLKVEIKKNSRHQ